MDDPTESLDYKKYPILYIDGGVKDLEAAVLPIFSCSCA